MIKTTISLKIPEPIEEALKRIAKAIGMTKSAYVRALIFDDLKQYGIISKEIIKNLKKSGDIPVDLRRLKEPK